MAKQRPTARVAPKKPVKSSPRAARPAARAKAAAPAKAASRPSASTAPKKKPVAAATATAPPLAPRGRTPTPPTAQPGRNNAMEVFEKGFRALQQRQYAKAAELFNQVLTAYPEEKELHERVRVYLAVCARQTAPADATPKGFDERVYEATLSVNRGAFAEGLTLLTALEREQPEHDHIQYMLAVVRTQRGEPEAALIHLEKAIRLKPSLRLLAGQDLDLEPLHDDPAFEALLEAPPRPAARERSGR